MKIGILISIVMWAGIISQLTGCASMFGESLFTSDDEGRFLLSADAEGIRAFGDAMNGLVTTGKSAPNVSDSYWQHRDNVVRFRAVRPSPTSAAKEAK